MFRCLVFLAIAVASVVAAIAASQDKCIVIYDGITTKISPMPESSKDLWITTTDLTRTTRFVIKPQGSAATNFVFRCRRIAKQISF